MGNDLFAFKINYNTTSMGAGNNPLYNGNISETIWKTANDVNTSNLTRGYAYNYDPLNRIVSANYGTKTSAAFNLTGDYDVWGIDYDKNGNIGHLKRKDQGLLMDDLIYTYDGNQLLSVKDDSTNIEGFKDGNTSGNDYTYDANGNMLSDANKEIADISYNHLNLPTKVTITGGSIEYVYDATGVKMRKTISTGTVTDYANNFIYENGDLKFFSTQEGYVDIVTVTTNTGFPYYFPQTSKEFHYIYQYKDHLGNVRLSYKDNNGTLEIIEENNYYPFGLKHKGYNTNITSTNIALKRKFGGKEYQDELGLDWYDITARNYDPALGRWMNVDPLAEMMRRHSPYNYAFNNPIFFIDPDGLAPTGATGLYGESFENSAVTRIFGAMDGGGEDDKKDNLTDVDFAKLQETITNRTETLNKEIITKTEKSSKLGGRRLNNNLEFIEELKKAVQILVQASEMLNYLSNTNNHPMTIKVGRMRAVDQLNNEGTTDHGGVFWGQNNKELIVRVNGGIRDYEAIIHELQHVYDFTTQSPAGKLGRGSTFGPGREGKRLGFTSYDSEVNAFKISHALGRGMPNKPRFISGVNLDWAKKALKPSHSKTN